MSHVHFSSLLLDRHLIKRVTTEKQGPPPDATAIEDSSALDPYDFLPAKEADKIVERGNEAVLLDLGSAEISPEHAHPKLARDGHARLPSHQMTQLTYHRPGR